MSLYLKLPNIIFLRIIFFNLSSKNIISCNSFFMRIYNDIITRFIIQNYFKNHKYIDKESFLTLNKKVNLIRI